MTGIFGVAFVAAVLTYKGFACRSSLLGSLHLRPFRGPGPSVTCAVRAELWPETPTRFEQVPYGNRPKSVGKPYSLLAVVGQHRGLACWSAVQKCPHEWGQVFTIHLPWQFRVLGVGCRYESSDAN